MRKQHYRNNANYQMSSDSEDCMTEFGGAGDSLLIISWHSKSFSAYSRKKHSHPMFAWMNRKERQMRIKVRHLIKSQGKHLLIDVFDIDFSILLDHFIPHLSEHCFYVFRSSQSAEILGHVSLLRRVRFSWLF